MFSFKLAPISEDNGDELLDNLQRNFFHLVHHPHQLILPFRDACIGVGSSRYESTSMKKHRTSAIFNDSLYVQVRFIMKFNRLARSVDNTTHTRLRNNSSLRLPTGWSWGHRRCSFLPAADQSLKALVCEVVALVEALQSVGEVNNIGTRLQTRKQSRGCSTTSGYARLLINI